MYLYKYIYICVYIFIYILWFANNSIGFRARHRFAHVFGSVMVATSSRVPAALVRDSRIKGGCKDGCGTNDGCEPKTGTEPSAAVCEPK